MRVKDMKIRQDLLDAVNNVEACVRNGYYEVMQQGLDELKQEVRELYSIAMGLQLEDFEDEVEKTKM